MDQKRAILHRKWCGIARVNDPSLGRFITADDIIQAVYNPQTLNRYSYCGNNPVNFIDPSGHSWFRKFIGKVIGGISAAVMFFASGGNIGIAANTYNTVESIITPAANNNWGVAVQNGLNSLAMGSGNPFLMASGFTGMLSYRAGEQGYNDLSRTLGYTSQGIAAAYTAWNVGVGVRDWAHESRFKIMDLNKNSSTIQSSDKVFVNGILNTEDTAVGNAIKAGANKLAYNPTSGPIADLVEAMLQKVTFTSSTDRQLANSLIGATNVSLLGHSQGAITIANTLLNLGIRDQRRVVTHVTYINTQISQPRAFISAAIGGAGNHVVYSSRAWDPSNAVGPNINPVKFASGVVGLVGGGFGVKYHGIQ